MSKSPLREIFDYKKDNTCTCRRRPIELAEYLNVPANKVKLIFFLKILYVLKPNKDELLKFGIAGAREGKESAWARLQQYVNTYGKQTDFSPCLGVKLYYIFAETNMMIQHKLQGVMVLNERRLPY